MNRVSQAFALAALAAASLASAQTSPSSPTPSSPSSTPSAPYPGSTAPSSSSQLPGPDAASDPGKAATQAQMKDCMSKQMANNSGQSKDDAKRYCKRQLSGSPNG